MKTVKELKDFIKDLPDDMLLAHYKDTMETSGYFVGLSCDVVNMKEETRYTWDRFDGTDYSYEVLLTSIDESGDPYLRIN